MSVEPIFQLGSPQVRVANACELEHAFPVMGALGRIAGIRPPSQVPVEDELEEKVERPEKLGQLPALSGPVPFHHHARGDSFVSGWPIKQSLSEANTLSAYYLASAVGGILDAFGIRWWAAHATLLGALRHGGLLPQEGDVDFAVWRSDSHWLVRPAFRSALAAAGVAIYQLPNYLAFRLCMVHAPPVADGRSVDGWLACAVPYVDIHLAGLAPMQADRWHYIYRTDKRYAISFPLGGLLRRSPGSDSLDVDMRLRHKFGDHAEVWVPRLETAEPYLAALYGKDWATVLRQRDGPPDRHGNVGLGAVVHNTTDGGFQGIFARPSGPLRDVVSELRALGVL
eukprot:gnl/TRDRNA2_/TRDRNA2_204280_c0_seq1.p1 gnl/TRDRNA2_/TRDRNA2_204280_c0~~gnl/TRDRNA2_/TRDRNA2_204280_c0_seq1.p1  ORF type:complete len:389 (+),score=47.06 gnl/TRDRNA2_/TRDRNA2_204280_c0_seq1:149-1168(+)